MLYNKVWHRERLDVNGLYGLFGSSTSVRPDIVSLLKGGIAPKDPQKEHSFCGNPTQIPPCWPADYLLTMSSDKAAVFACSYIELMQNANLPKASPSAAPHRIRIVPSTSIILDQTLADNLKYPYYCVKKNF